MPPNGTPWAGDLCMPSAGDRVPTEVGELRHDVRLVRITTKPSQGSVRRTSSPEARRMIRDERFGAAGHGRSVRTPTVTGVSKRSRRWRPS
jgi:hypothetical protein